MQFNFIPVTAENRSEALSLHVSPAQTWTVETVAECLAEAAELPLWRPVLIQAQGESIGFAMYGLWIMEGTNGRVWLDRFFIDRRHQGKGLAKACLPLLIEQIRREYGCSLLYLSVYADNLPAIHLYEGLDFAFNGELDTKGEKVMVRTLRE